MKEELFRKSSLENLTSLEKLDSYIKVTNPGAWLVILGIFLLLASAAIWSGAAGLKTSVPVSGVVEGNEIHIFVTPEQAEDLEEGMEVEEANQRIGEILRIAGEPVSREEAGTGYLTDYYRDTKLEDWNVEVIVSNERGIQEMDMVSGQVVTEETRILKFIIE